VVKKVIEEEEKFRRLTADLANDRDAPQAFPTSLDASMPKELTIPAAPQ
jgi:hypothetical protein